MIHSKPRNYNDDDSICYDAITGLRVMWCTEYMCSYHVGCEGDRMLDEEIWKKNTIDNATTCAGCGALMQFDFRKSSDPDSAFQNHYL